MTAPECLDWRGQSWFCGDGDVCSQAYSGGGLLVGAAGTLSIFWQVEESQAQWKKGVPLVAIYC